MVSCAVLIAVGINPERHRTLLGVSVSLSEAEVHWRAFLAGLQDRGLHGVKLVVSDGHAGLKAAREARLAGVAWQLSVSPAAECRPLRPPHLHAQRSGCRSPGDLRCTRPGRSRSPTGTGRPQVREDCPKLEAWLSAIVPEGLTVFAFPAAHRRRLRTSNLLERLNKEISCTRVAALFPNEATLLRLVSAVLMEISEEWETEKIYLRMENSGLIAREE